MVGIQAIWIINALGCSKQNAQKNAQCLCAFVACDFLDSCRYHFVLTKSNKKIQNHICLHYSFSALCTEHFCWVHWSTIYCIKQVLIVVKLFVVFNNIYFCMFSQLFVFWCLSFNWLLWSSLSLFSTTMECQHHNAVLRNCWKVHCIQDDCSSFYISNVISFNHIGYTYQSCLF